MGQPKNVLFASGHCLIHKRKGKKNDEGAGKGGEKKKCSSPIEDSSRGKGVNNAAPHTARRLRGAIAMATPFSSHIFNEKVMRET